MELIAAFVPVLLLAVLLGLFMARIGQLPIMGYLLAGVIYGSVRLPFALRAETLGFLGELGIILLLFYLGMKLSWRQVAPIVGRSFALAMAVMGIPFLFTHGALLLLGMRTGEALLAAFALSMTSTAIGFQILEVRGELSGRLALLVVGVNIVLDILAVIVLAVLGTTAGQDAPLTERLLRMGAFVAVIGTAGLFLIPRLLDFVHDHPNSRMILPVVLIATGIGVALLGSRFELPLSIGAFLAGSLAAEARCREDLAAYLHPIKELFIVFFFVGIGFQISPESMLRLLPTALIILLILLVVRSITVAAAGYILGEDGPISVAMAAALLPVGEFSFLLISEAGISPATRESLMALTGLLTFMTAFLVEPGIIAAPKIENWIYRTAPDSLRHLTYVLRGSIAPSLSPFAPKGSAVRHAIRDLGFTSVLIAGLAVAITELSAYLDSVTPAWADFRLAGFAVALVVLVPALVLAWRRWKHLLDVMIGPYKTGPGTERIRLVQRTTRGALSTVAVALIVLALVPIVFTVIGGKSVIVVIAVGVAGLLLAWIFRKEVHELHMSLEMGMGGRPAANRKTKREAPEKEEVKVEEAGAPKG